MCIIDMSCRRRGTSTIYGVMIFIGIMFTAVIPMLLVMNQADTLHEMRKVEVGRLDEERALEDIYFYLALTVVDKAPVLTLKISNRGELAVRIKGVWVNDTLRDDFDCIIPPISNMDLEIGELMVPDPTEPVIYHILAVTDRGNIFSPTCGIPKYDPDLMVWTMDDFVILVTMEKRMHNIHIIVEKLVPPDPPETLCDEDFPAWFFSYSINVPYVEETTNYQVEVYQFYEQHPSLLVVEVVSLSVLDSSAEVRVPA